MTTFFVLAGNSGSGKSTIAMNMLEDLEGAEIVSADEIRAELGSESNQNLNTKVFWQIEEHLKHTEAKHCIIDATNARIDDRRRLIQWCKRPDSYVVLVFVDTPLEICVERQLLRDRQVPQAALERMDRALKQHPPSKEDGADEFIHIVHF